MTDPIKETTSPDPWLSGPDVDRYLGISHQTRWRWIRAGKLPPGIAFSPTAKRWRKSWIDEAAEALHADQRVPAGEGAA